MPPRGRGRPPSGKVRLQAVRIPEALLPALQDLSVARGISVAAMAGELITDALALQDQEKKGSHNHGRSI